MDCHYHALWTDMDVRTHKHKKKMSDQGEGYQSSWCLIEHFVKFLTFILCVPLFYTSIPIPLEAQSCKTWYTSFGFFFFFLITAIYFLLIQKFIKQKKKVILAHLTVADNWNLTEYWINNNWKLDDWNDKTES